MMKCLQEMMKLPVTQNQIEVDCYTEAVLKIQLLFNSIHVLVLIIYVLLVFL